MQKYQSAISLALIGTSLTFLFGGWSTVVAAIIVGALVGFTYGQRSALHAPADLGREAVIPGLISSVVVFVGSALHLFVVRPATGQRLNFMQTLGLPGNPQLPSVAVLIVGGVLALILGSATAFFAAHTQGLPAQQRNRNS